MSGGEEEEASPGDLEMADHTSVIIGGNNAFIMHHTCEDHIAAPLILDFVILAELFERIEVKKGTRGSCDSHMRGCHVTVT